MVETADFVFDFAVVVVVAEGFPVDFAVFDDLAAAVVGFELPAEIIKIYCSSNHLMKKNLKRRVG